MGLVMFSSLAIIEMEILLKQAPDWASGYSKEGNLNMQDWISHRTSTLLQVPDPGDAVLSEKISSGMHVSWEKRLRETLWLTQIN